MSVDQTILALMTGRKRYDKYSRAVPANTLNAQTNALMKDFGKYFEQHPSCDRIEFGPFHTWFKVAHPTLSDDNHLIYATILKRVCEDKVSPEIEAGIMDRVISLHGANQMQDLIARFNEGGEFNLLVEMGRIRDAMEADTVRKVKSVEVTTDISEMLTEDENDTGLHWRLELLNRSIRPLRGGDFGIIAGRPDKGKTSWLTDNLTHMAKQIDAIYPGQGRSILWFNNEGPGKRIKYRMYQSALNATTQELVGKQQAGTLETEYLASIGGRADLLRVFDIHDWWNWEVEDLLKTLKPALIVLDMVDNIKFGGGVANNGQRTDQLLEEMYKWARNIAVKYDVPVLATSQISADGDGMSYPTLSMLKDSKTGKQGAAEFIMTLGALNEISMQSSRFIGMTKNKLHKEGGPRDPRLEVVFDGLRGRYNTPMGV